MVQRVDTVSEGIENYGGKITAVETDLKKLGKSPAPEFELAHLSVMVKGLLHKSAVFR